MAVPSGIISFHLLSKSINVVIFGSQGSTSYGYCGLGASVYATSPVLREKTHRKKNSLQEYPEHLFGNNVVKERRQTYVSSENYERVRTLLSVIAPTLSISCYIDNILSAHLEQYRDELNAIYSSRINLKPL